MSLVQNMGHLYAEWTPFLYYTDADTPELRKQVDNIRIHCNTCKRHQNESYFFRIALLQEDCILNRTVHINIMKLDKKISLHVVDKDTIFSVASFPEDEILEDVW